MQRVLLSFLLLLLFNYFLEAQSALLQSGPMLGYSEMKEVLLWVQTTEPTSVQIEYWDKKAPDDKRRTEVGQTSLQSALAVKLIADQVGPGKTYEYRLLLNGKPVSFNYPLEFQTQPHWQYRTDPPEFSLAVGSCYFLSDAEVDRPGNPYGGAYQIFSSMHQKRPDLMLWLGDNVYLRAPDWYTKTGIIYRNTLARSLPELQPLLASTHHYAIWDDHDFGPNDSDRSFIHKDKTLEAFRLFWGNPSYGLDGEHGITTYFQWNDMDFFLLDNRYFRTPNYKKTGEKTMLGRDQIDWLIDVLVKSQAPFKFVAIGGQVLSTSPVHENYIHHFPEERAYLLSRIEQEGITGVVFLDGDRHHTEMSHYRNAAGNDVYDLTISPLTSGAATNPEQNNKLRIDGTLVTQRNFGILTFSGPRAEREMKIEVFNSNGGLLWEKTIQAPK